MKVAYTFPPNYAAVANRFNIGNRTDIIFTYGDTLYVPNGRKDIPEHLMIHEEIHSKQQGKDPKTWWMKYLGDDDFRLRQELEAYRAQYFYIRKTESRQRRRSLLDYIVKNLSGSMYGNMISSDEARRLVEAR